MKFCYLVQHWHLESYLDLLDKVERDASKRDYYFNYFVVFHNPSFCGVEIWGEEQRICTKTEDIDNDKGWVFGPMTMSIVSVANV